MSRDLIIPEYSHPVITWGSEQPEPDSFLLFCDHPITHVPWFIAFKEVYYLYQTQHNFVIEDTPGKSGRRPDSYFQELYAKILPESEELPPPSVVLVQQCFEAYFRRQKNAMIPAAFFSTKDAYEQRRYDVMLYNVFVSDMVTQDITLGNMAEFNTKVRISYGDYKIHKDSNIVIPRPKLLTATKLLGAK
jgi:hypothetical protein